jgi:hypothetical protein
MLEASEATLGRVEPSRKVRSRPTMLLRCAAGSLRNISCISIGSWLSLPSVARATCGASG